MEDLATIVWPQMISSTQSKTFWVLKKSNFPLNMAQDRHTQYTAFWWFLLSYRCWLIWVNIIAHSIKFQTIYTKHLWVDFTTYKPNNRVYYCKLKKMYLEKNLFPFIIMPKIFLCLSAEQSSYSLFLYLLLLSFPKIYFHDTIS